jgi:site-specific DNA-methyltransferase (adenine-specific)
MCSYLGSFPAALAHAFVERFSRPGDVVLDPFSGRGTVPLQAAVERRIGAGNDANPLAYLLTAAKIDAPTRLDVEARLARLRIDWSIERSDWLSVAHAGAGALVELRTGGFEFLAPEVVSAFDPGALAQLLFLRRRLDLAERADRFLAAAIVGILHGRSRAYVSDSMPNGFSLAPAYLGRSLAARGRPPAPRDVLALLLAKVHRLYRDGLPPTRGVAVQTDARDAGSRIAEALRSHGLPDRARLVVTSPPYLRTLRYGSVNWLRLWFLGEDPIAVDRAMDTPRSAVAYARFLAEVLEGLRPALTDDAVVVLVIGDVTRDLGKARREDPALVQGIWESAAEPLGYRLAGVVRDPVPANRKLTRLWGPEAGRATDTERILVLGATELGRRRAVAALPRSIDWQWPATRPTWPGGARSRAESRRSGGDRKPVGEEAAADPGGFVLALTLPRQAR